MRCPPIVLSTLLALAAPLAAQSVDGRVAAHPNEPAGYVPWFDHDWRTMPLIGSTGWHAASGTGYFHAWNPEGWPASNVQWVDDSGTPSGKALRIRAGQGWGSGVSNGVNMSLRSTPGRPFDDPATVTLEDLYLSYWILFESNPADGGYLETAILRQWTANRQIIGEPSNFGLSFRANGDPGGFMDVWLWGRDSPSSTPVTFAARTPAPRPGVWYHVELVVERDSYGTTEPTRFRLWQNGQQLADDLDRAWMAYPFAELFFNPNRSGGGSRSRTDWFRIADVYVSGVPFGG